MIEFTSAYETGFPEVDRQHKKLFDTLNTLEKDIERGMVEHVLPMTLVFLKTYTRHHFSLEEGCMAKHQCPIAEKNKQAHRNLIELVPTFEERLSREGPTEKLAKDIYDFLVNWLSGHILKIDTHLRSCKGR
ncbi:hemerythrin family protein [bacterium]|nr:hemerythrin family protein [bacterium]